MQDLKIILVQADQIWEDKLANLANYDRLLASVDDSDLIVLPEMFHTGFSMNAPELAESMDDSIGISWLRNKSSQLNSAIYTSMIISEKGNYFNRGIFMCPDGSIHTYDKRKSFGLAGEDQIYTAGKHPLIVTFRGWKIMLQICYDLRFPELVRNKIIDGEPMYDLLLYVANWPERRAEHWKTLLKARAIENQSFVAGVNRVGKDGKDLIYSGDSALIDALGVETTLDTNSESVMEITLNRSEIEHIRTNLPFLKDQDC